MGDLKEACGSTEGIVTGPARGMVMICPECQQEIQINDPERFNRLATMCSSCAAQQARDNEKRLRDRRLCRKCPHVKGGGCLYYEATLALRFTVPDGEINLIRLARCQSDFADTSTGEWRLGRRAMKELAELRPEDGPREVTHPLLQLQKTKGP